jgi:hypothetical protein
VNFVRFIEPERFRFRHSLIVDTKNNENNVVEWTENILQVPSTLELIIVDPTNFIPFLKADLYSGMRKVKFTSKSMIHLDDFILSDQLKEMEVGVTPVVFRDPEIEFNKLNLYFKFQICIVSSRTFENF